MELKTVDMFPSFHNTQSKMSLFSILNFKLDCEVRKCIIDAEKMYQYNCVQILPCHEQISPFKEGKNKVIS